MPADLRHKVIVLAGDSSSPTQLGLLKEFADYLDSPNGFVKRFTPKGLSFDAVFDIISITNTNKFVVNYNDIPERLWSHWSKYVTPKFSALHRQSDHSLPEYSRMMRHIVVEEISTKTMAYLLKEVS